MVLKSFIAEQKSSRIDKEMEVNKKRDEQSLKFKAEVKRELGPSK